jgi:hypothetical protein
MLSPNDRQYLLELARALLQGVYDVVHYNYNESWDYQRSRALVKGDERLLQLAKDFGVLDKEERDDYGSTNSEA